MKHRFFPLFYLVKKHDPCYKKKLCEKVEENSRHIFYGLVFGSILERKTLPWCLLFWIKESLRNNDIFFHRIFCKKPFFVQVTLKNSVGIFLTCFTNFGIGNLFLCNGSMLVLPTSKSLDALPKVSQILIYL